MIDFHFLMAVKHQKRWSSLDVYVGRDSVPPLNFHPFQTANRFSFLVTVAVLPFFIEKKNQIRFGHGRGCLNVRFCLVCVYYRDLSSFLLIRTNSAKEMEREKDEVRFYAHTRLKLWGGF